MGRRGIAQGGHKLAIQVLAPSQHHAPLQSNFADLGRCHARPQQRARHQADAEARQHGRSAALLVGRAQHGARTHAFGRDQPCRLVMRLAGGAQDERRVGEVLDRPAIARRDEMVRPPRPAGKVRATRTRRWPRSRPRARGKRATSQRPRRQRSATASAVPSEISRSNATWPCAGASQCMADGHRHGGGEGDAHQACAPARPLLGARQPPGFDHGAGVRQQALPRGGQRRATAAVEQAAADLLLEAGDAGRQGRLGDVAALGRFGEVAGLRHRQEIADEGQIHR